jgi:phosphopantothenate---cysteine ligase (CTP)
MNWLVTAGGTAVPIDKVRAITNSSTGRTGAAIAIAAHRAGHRVTLLTSEPNTVREAAGTPPSGELWAIRTYRTLDGLHKEMADLLGSGRFDALVQSAAVSDYLAAGVYAPAAGTKFDPDSAQWKAKASPEMIERQGPKIGSDAPELWVRLIQAPKLVDLARSAWRFRGVLVKFKLEVDVNDRDLLATAERSRQDSDADLMVANSLEGAREWAWLGPAGPGSVYARVARSELPARLIEAVVQCHERRRHV